VGRLIYLSTGLSRRAREGMITLGTAKAALDQFVRYVELELAPHGITANLVAPATVEGTRVTALPRRAGNWGDLRSATVVLSIAQELTQYPMLR
jgi:NAD(P)-dependent dehydrogenase (short-subunit alcohol dehydrogenase family)